jgi:LSD1 subclass zinc finger protein
VSRFPLHAFFVCRGAVFHLHEKRISESAARCKAKRKKEFETERRYAATRYNGRKKDRKEKERDCAAELRRGIMKTQAGNMRTEKPKGESMKPKEKTGKPRPIDGMEKVIVRITPQGGAPSVTLPAAVPFAQFAEGIRLAARKSVVRCDSCRQIFVQPKSAVYIRCPKCRAGMQGVRAGTEKKAPEPCPKCGNEKDARAAVCLACLAAVCVARRMNRPKRKGKAPAPTLDPAPVNP